MYQRIAEILKEYPDARKYLIRLFLHSILKSCCPTDSRTIFIYLQKAIDISPMEIVDVFFESLDKDYYWVRLLGGTFRENEIILFTPLFIEIKNQDGGIIPQFVELSKKFSKGMSSLAQKEYARIEDGRLFGFTKNELLTLKRQQSACSSTTGVTVDAAALKRAENYDLGFRLLRIIRNKEAKQFQSLVQTHPIALDYIAEDIETGLTLVLLAFFYKGDDDKWILPIMTHRPDLQRKLENALNSLFSQYRISTIQPSAGLNLLQKLGLQRMPDSTLVRKRDSEYHCARLAKLDGDEFIEEFQQAHQVLEECHPWIHRLKNDFFIKMTKTVLTLRPDFKPEYYRVFFESLNHNLFTDETDLLRNHFFKLEKHGLIDPKLYIATFSEYVWSYQYDLSCEYRKPEKQRLIMTMEELRFIHEMTPVEIISHVPKALRKPLSFLGADNEKAILLKDCLGLTTMEYNEGLTANR